MKKILLMIACVAIAFGAYAQEGFSYGVKVGANASNYWGKDTKHGMKIGYQAGIFAEIPVATSISVAPELVFSSQGGKFSGTSNIANYINLPIMAKFYVAPKVSIDFGPQIGYMVYNKCKGVDLKDACNKFDFGLGLGASYNITSDIFVQARYTLGLTNVYKGGSAKNGDIQLALGYRF